MAARHLGQVCAYGVKAMATGHPVVAVQMLALVHGHMGAASRDWSWGRRVPAVAAGFRLRGLLPGLGYCPANQCAHWTNVCGSDPLYPK